MKFARFSVVAALSLASVLPCAHAADDLGAKLTLDQKAWPRLQGRLQLNTLDAAPTGQRLLSASVLGDYYLTGSLLGQRNSGGLRATSGFLVGPASLTLGSNSLGAPSGLSVNRQSMSLWSAMGDTGEATSTLPYIGIGYTGQSASGTWGFKADFGLVGMGANSGLRLGRSPSQSLDDVLRDLRFKPVIQVGLNYAF